MISIAFQTFNAHSRRVVTNISVLALTRRLISERITSYIITIRWTQRCVIRIVFILSVTFQAIDTLSGIFISSVAVIALTRRLIYKALTCYFILAIRWTQRCLFGILFILSIAYQSTCESKIN
jgi:hypothetical protein